MAGMLTETDYDDELPYDTWEPGDECPEGGDHWRKVRAFDDGSTYEMCTECGVQLDDEDLDEAEYFFGDED